jgi:transposase-like protein
MEANRRDPRRERLWREAMAGWQGSGLSVRQYCRRRQLSESAFYFWRRELQRRAVQRVPSTSPHFVPVSVLASATVEVRCPSGHVVSLATADAATLRMLFAALVTEASC